MVLQNIRIYLRESKKLMREYPQNFRVWDLVRFFPDWQRSLDDKVSPLTDERPWITFTAIEKLDQILTKDMRVFEYGVGGSTLFFVKRVKEVISVEHDPNWFAVVSEPLKKHGCRNWQGHLVEPTQDELFFSKDCSDPVSYISGSDNFMGKSFQDYVTIIEQYPNNYFDLILIDGRARVSCFKHSLQKINLNGYIVWDNTDREYYFDAMKEASPLNYSTIELPGPSPYVNFFTKTSIWYRNK